MQRFLGISWNVSKGTIVPFDSQGFFRSRGVQPPQPHGEWLLEPHKIHGEFSLRI
jgi:hypothetical protein